MLSRQQVLSLSAMVATLAVAFSFGIHTASYLPEIAVGNCGGTEKARDRTSEQL